MSVIIDDLYFKISWHISSSLKTRQFSRLQWDSESECPRTIYANYIQQFISQMPISDDKHDDTKTMNLNGTAERFNYVQQEVHHLRGHKPE